MTRTHLALVLVVASALAPSVARADAPPPADTAAPSPSPSPAARPPQGVAVVAGPGVRDEAFLAARSLYATRLRPRRLDEARARTLAGDPVAEGAPTAVRELGELRAAVAGDDAASRSVLASIAKRVNASALLVLVREGEGEGAPVVGRLFLADTGELDAARYAPVPGEGGAPTWRPVIASLERRFPPAEGEAATARPPEVKPQPFREAPPKREESKPFYTSAWLWAGIGAAALLGGIFYVASRDTASDPIHLQVHLPR